LMSFVLVHKTREKGRKAKVKYGKVAWLPDPNKQKVQKDPTVVLGKTRGSVKRSLRRYRKYLGDKKRQKSRAGKW